MSSLPSIVVEMIEEREEETSRIGGILHDEIGQLITAAGLQLDALRREFSNNGAAVVRVNEIQGVFDQVITLVRELSHSLPASAVERTGLGYALDRLVGRFREQSGRPIRLMIDSSAHPQGRKARAMHRIAECAIENAIRHSQASLIEVMLRPTSRGVDLEVRDDGCGFDVPPLFEGAPGVGLLLMEHSARRTGLQLTIRSQPGAGTIIRIRDRVLDENRPNPAHPKEN